MWFTQSLCVIFFLYLPIPQCFGSNGLSRPSLNSLCLRWATFSYHITSCGPGSVFCLSVGNILLCPSTTPFQSKPLLFASHPGHFSTLMSNVKFGFWKNKKIALHLISLHWNIKETSLVFCLSKGCLCSMEPLFPTLLKKNGSEHN